MKTRQRCQAGTLETRVLSESDRSKGHSGVRRMSVRRSRQGSHMSQFKSCKTSTELKEFL